MEDTRIKNCINVGTGGQWHGRWCEYIVMAEFTDGRLEDLYSFYPDEYWIDPQSLIGMTSDQARDVCRNRDISYLRS